MNEAPDDLLEPEETPEEADEPQDEDEEPRWGGEESLGLLPPD